MQIGAQWGDEGKGKVVDMLSSQADVVCRCQVSDLFLVNEIQFLWNIGYYETAERETEKPKN
jgi:Adenylosuccinate synthetase